MGQMRMDAGRGSLVRATNYTSWIHVEEDIDYNVEAITGTALAEAIETRTMLTLVNRAPMVPGTLCLTFTDAASADARLTVEVRGRDGNGAHRSERISFSGVSTVQKKQTSIGYIWIDSIEPVGGIGLDALDSLNVGFDNRDLNSNTAAGLLIPGSPRSNDELTVQFVDAFTDPPALAVQGLAANFEAQLWYPALRTGNRSYRFAVHPDRC